MGGSRGGRICEDEIKDDGIRPGLAQRVEQLGRAAARPGPISNGTQRPVVYINKYNVWMGLYVAHVAQMDVKPKIVQAIVDMDRNGEAPGHRNRQPDRHRSGSR